MMCVTVCLSIFICSLQTSHHLYLCRVHGCYFHERWNWNENRYKRAGQFWICWRRFIWDLRKLYWELQRWYWLFENQGKDEFNGVHDYENSRTLKVMRSDRRMYKPIKNKAMFCVQNSVVLNEEFSVLKSCFRRPITKNSFLEELRLRRVADIQEEICCRALWRWAIIYLLHVTKV